MDQSEREHRAWGAIVLRLLILGIDVNAVGKGDVARLLDALHLWGEELAALRLGAGDKGVKHNVDVLKNTRPRVPVPILLDDGWGWEEPAHATYPNPHPY